MNDASLTPRSGIRRSGPEISKVRAGLSPFAIVRKIEMSKERLWMKTRKKIRTAEQPEPFTPGLSKALVREQAQRLFDQRLLDHDTLTPDDWVMAEYELVEELQKNLS